MAELLLHKQDLSEETIERLSKQGVITIQTEDPEGFRFLSIEPASIRTDDFVWASLDALQAAGPDGSKGAHRLVKNLSDLAALEQLKKKRK